MKEIKKTLILIMMLLGIMSFSITALAEEDWRSLLGTVVDDSVLTDEEESTGNALKMLRGYYLSDGSSYISNRGNGVIYISGSTNCYRTADKLEVNIFLQRLVGNSWETVTYQYYSESNTNYAHNGFYIYVPTGYFYRTVTNHTAIKGDTVEYLTSKTDWLYI